MSNIGNNDDDALRVWLRDLGLEELCSTFERHRISFSDVAVLGLDEMVEQDTTTDTRDRLLNGIKDLASGEWSRRHLTVLCCDMIDSVGLSERLDPEDYGDVLTIYRECCNKVIDKHQGYIAEWSGDGLMAHFGYPSGDEHAPMHAVDAGLDLLETLGAQNWPTAQSLGFRIGVTTGTVVIGPGYVAGRTPNLASRLQAVAEPNTVVIDDDVRGLLRGAYDCETQGEFTLKGISQPCRVWTIRGRSDAESRFHAANPPGSLTTMFGRQAEFNALLESWERAKRGKGSVAVIRGAAGIGKSRLIEAIRLALSEESLTQLRFHGSPLREPRQFDPLVRYIERAAAIRIDDIEATRTKKIAQFIDHADADVHNALATVCSLLGLTDGATPLHEGSSEARRREVIMNTMQTVFSSIIERGPVLMIIEDVHWVDAQSLELFVRIIERIVDSPILCLVSQRIEQSSEHTNAAAFVNSILEQPNVQSFDLTELCAEDASAIVCEIGGAALPASTVLEKILARAGGLPLYLEEMTRYVIATQPADGDLTWNTSQGSTYEHIPATLQDALTARLDGLGQAKQVAQMAAAIGREFAVSHLVAALGLDDREVKQALTRLCDAQIVQPLRSAQSDVYVFKHALLQDAAYQGLLRKQRQVLHECIARAIEQQFPAVIALEPEVLARHFEAAAQPVKATEYWSLAAERAREVGAVQEARDYVEAGRQTLAQMADDASALRLEIELCMTAGKVAFVSLGSGAAQVEYNFTRALALCDASRNSLPGTRVNELRSEALRGLWGFRFVRAEFQRAHELATQLLEHANLMDEDETQIEARRVLGMTMLYMGRFASAREHLEAGLSLYDNIDKAKHLNKYANDPGVACLCYLSKAMWFLGFTDQSRKLMADGIELAKMIDHPFTSAQANALSAMLSTHMREPSRVRAAAQSTLELIERHGDFPLWTRIVAVVGEWANLPTDDDKADLSKLAEHIVDYQNTSSFIVRPMFYGLLADAQRKNGDINAAKEMLARAVLQARQTEEGYYAAELARISGLIALADSGGRDSATLEAERCFREAIDLAQRQQAVSWELRAAVSLASLLQSTGRTDESLLALQDVVMRARTGGESPDLFDACELLKHLQSDTQRSNDET